MKTKLLVIAACCIPYAFLSLYGDAAYGTMAFYAIMIVSFTLICRVSIRTRNIPILYIGNVSSCIVSLAAARMSGLNQMDWYFKPFTATSLIIAVSALTILIQTVFVIISIRKHNSKGSKDS